MKIDPSSLLTALPAANLASATDPTKNQASTFGSFLSQGLNEIKALRAQAEHQVQGVLLGDGTDLHTAMISVEKANLAFEYGLAVRNKLLGAYQQIMNTQI